MSESCVYIQDAEHGWLPAHVLHQDDVCVKVRVFNVDQGDESIGERTVHLQDYAPSHALPLQNVDASGKLLEMPDMVDLPSLHEAAILYNLRARHLDSKPYTRVGDLIVAVNPFQWRRELYSEVVRNQYVDKLIWNVNTSGGDARAGLAPHVYETSSMAYRGLAAEGQHQSILVSGESGAGKTETVKIVMSHLASVHSSNETESHHLVVQRVLDSHPLLEAFGNAKTVRNDNSSRFGKFIQMQFDVEDAITAAHAGRAVPNCVLAGSTCETYLLEKSRVVGHETQERTYHVFYQLLAAPNDVKSKFWNGLVDKTNESFRYVGATDTDRIEGKTDAQRWETTLEALQLLDVKDERLLMLIRAVCVVMQLGNLTFAPDPHDEEKSIITSKDELTLLAELMGVSQEALEKALTYRTVVAGKGETYTVPLKVERACDGCDAFAKEIYQRAFGWLVRQINMVTCAEENYDDAAHVEEYGKIGLLDIFGFESFETNRFEQLCINYTNEKLQQKYTLDIFCSVQEEYEQEGIELGEITFEDNAEVLRLMEGRVGIISVLNEECVRPNGSDTGFVSKIKSVNKETPYLISENLHKPTEFAIQHYAGQVTYDATNFVQKNTDTLPRDVIDVACMSSNGIIRVEVKAAAESKMGTGAEAAKRPATRGAANHTVTSKFKHQLSHLMHAITKTKTRYIRCIKPNPEKLPLKMNMGTSAEQLRCAGVVAAVTISRVAFPNRLMHETAVERFACLKRSDADQSIDEKKEETNDDVTGFRESVSTLLTALLKELETTGEDGKVTKAFEIGKSRVYFRTGALEYLEAKRLLALGSFATAIERIVRGFTARSVFWKLKYAVIDSQANARRTIARTTFLEKKQACIAIECWARCVYAKRELKRLQREAAAIQLQSKWRSIQAVLMLVKCREAAVMIEKIARGAIQRPKYRLALKEAEEEARVNSKLAALQKRLKEAEMKWIQADKQRIAAEKRAEGIVGSPEGAAHVAPAAPSTPTKDVAEEEKKSDTLSPNQQELIHESNEMVEYFKQELFKLKSANYLLRTDLATLRETNHSLTDHNVSLEASHSALRQNVTKLSQSNMRLAENNSEQKDSIHKLKQELKMEKIRTNSEVKSLQDQLNDKDRQHENEMNRMRREMERLRKIIAKTPDKGPQKYERATFNRSGNKSGGVPGMPRVSSLENMSVTSTLASSEEEWGHDAFMERPKTPRKEPSSSWTVVKKRERRPRKPRYHAAAQANRRHSGDGPRGRNWTPNKDSSSKQYTSPTKKPLPKSSLAAAATKSTCSPANSRPNSRPPSRANSPAPKKNNSRRGSLNKSGSSKSSLKSPTGNSAPPKRTLSQSNLSSKSLQDAKTLPRVHSQGHIHHAKK